MFRPFKISAVRHFIIISLMLIGAVGTLSAQDELDTKILFDKFYNKPQGGSKFRAFLNKFSLGVSTGYGRTYYKHDLSGLGVMQIRDARPILFPNNSDITDDELTSAYTNWFSGATQVSDVPIDDSRNDFLVNSDSVELGYKATARSIPVNLSLNYSFDRYRVGLGATFEFHKIHEFNPISFSDNLQSFTPQANKATFKRYYLTLGGRVYSYYDYSLMVDAQVGIMKLGGNFDKSVIKKGVYFNLGASMEREFSEYFTVFLRPSFEIKNFKVNLPDGPTITHRQPALFLNIGAYLKLPEHPRCKIKNCQIQINHTHGGGKNWRSRMHPFFKKQNPHYGENFPKLLKEKRKNKKKLNPF